MTINEPLSPESRVGVVGSNSSTGTLTVDLVGDSRSRSLAGKMVVLASEEADGSREYGLGTVTEIVTTNQYHENPALRGVVALTGRVGNLTGRADIKTARVEMQSAFRHDGNRTRPVGGSLTFAPSTGEGVHLVNNDLIQGLAREAVQDLFYLGSMYRQRDILLPLSFHDFSGPRGASMCAFFGPSGSGKALDCDTPIPTPDGFVRMGNLTPGSRVFDERGLPCNVVAVFDQPPGRECFEVKFSDGSTLVADAEHQWEVCTPHMTGTFVLTTAHLDARMASGEQFCVPATEPVQMPSAANPPQSPDRLGARVRMLTRPMSLSDRRDPAAGEEQRRTLALPGEFLHATVQWRTALLNSLMGDEQTFTTASDTLAHQVRVLAASLGKQGTVTTRPNGTYTVYVSTRPDADRYIVSITPVASRPVRCITVDSPRSLYLAGDNFIPTHNTYTATTFAASQTRHRDMAFLLIDPQGQFITDSKMGRELPLDLRALAEAQGRDVQQLSVAHEVRLPQDAGLFVDLLDGATFFGASRLIGARSNAKEAREVVLAWLEDSEDAKDWSSKDPEVLFGSMLNHLIERVEAGAVSVTEKVKDRVSAHLISARDRPTEAGEATRAAMLRVWKPFLSLFAPHGANGTARKSMKDIVKGLCDQDTGYAGNRKGRPFYVLTLADPRTGRGGDPEISRAMKQSKTQMTILRTLFAALEDEGRRMYQDESKAPANLMVILDEAARFTSDSNRDQQQRDMAAEMARFFRELRKYAIGFTLILQEPSALHPSIWKQLQNGFRAFAGGLVGNDLDKVREQITSPGALRMYQQLAQPTADNSVYPWVFCGSISPLNVTSDPSFLEAFTTPAEWAAANKSWLPGTYHVSDVWRG